jgi:hypothetical protein
MCAAIAITMVIVHEKEGISANPAPVVPMNFVRPLGSRNAFSPAEL